MHICIHYRLSAKQIIGCVCVRADAQGEHNMLSMEMDAVDITNIIKGTFLFPHGGGHAHKHKQMRARAHTADPAQCQDEDGSHFLVGVTPFCRCKVTGPCQCTNHAGADLRLSR